MFTPAIFMLVLALIVESMVLFMVYRRVSELMFENRDLKEENGELLIQLRELHRRQIRTNPPIPSQPKKSVPVVTTAPIRKQREEDPSTFPSLNTSPFMNDYTSPYHDSSPSYHGGGGDFGGGGASSDYGCDSGSSDSGCSSSFD